MFAIDPSNPLKIKRVGEPVDSGGEFPVSVAVESKAGLGTIHSSHLSIPTLLTCSNSLRP